MKKVLLIAMLATVLVVAVAGLAVAAPGVVSPNVYSNGSTHPQGSSSDSDTIDGYNYNSPQDYTEATGYAMGPHGGYLTTTHKCRECHAVHRAKGKFKLTRADEKFQACDWCHGSGAGSGDNIAMDNDPANPAVEYNVGHTMGFGVSAMNKAPDDTYPAFTPQWSNGGFSCFDCHTPHANQARLLGYNNKWTSSNSGTDFGYPATAWAQTYGIANPGHQQVGDPDWLNPGGSGKPIYRPGSWLLIKNPDRELDPSTGLEILDTDTSLKFAGTFDALGFPVNKMATDWDRPFGGNSDGSTYNPSESVVFTVNEFCADCHDGNAGLSTVQAPLFSEEKALTSATETGTYELAYGHDAQPRH